MKYMSSLFILVVCALSGCAATNSQKKYGDLPLSEGAFNKSSFSELNRFPPRYPERAAKNSEEGCATVEYVVTPDYEIEDIKVVSATKHYFATSAKQVVQNWKWAEISSKELDKPIKVMTRFEFCLNESDFICSDQKLSSACPGQDVIYSVGSAIIR
uniref:energy transducer TonB n=1 Tax=Ningiella ruwaisensis TaxID=2364274 RepID=UPI00109FD2AF|nr:energy transducer TonB [Ningiella ruwaisensis]